MSNLREELEESYNRHPAFGIGVRPLCMSAADLQEFSAAYESLAEYAARMSPTCFAATQARCEELFVTLWRSFEGQCSEQHERWFFAELGAEVRRLLAEELAFHRVGRRANGISFGAKDSLGGALSLHRERHFFGCLSVPAVKRILALGAPHLDRFRTVAAAGKFRRDDLTLNQGDEIRAIMAILNAEFARNGVLDALAAYSGQRVWVNGLALELSVPQSRWWESAMPDLPRPPHTVYAHLDEAIANPKAIVYLTDVTHGHGPTSCYPHAFDDLALNPLQALVGRVVGNVGNRAESPLREYYEKRYHQSMSSERFRRHFLRLPSELRFNSHFGWDVLPDSDVEKNLAARERHMIGGPGTYIVFDGARLLHRGGMPQVGERIALQVVFEKTSFLRRFVRNVRSAIQ
jgi:hypothetical protein